MCPTVSQIVLLSTQSDSKTLEILFICVFDCCTISLCNSVKECQIVSKVTVRIAAELTGKSRETINNATKDGTLSYTKNGRNHKVIDVSELERIYPLVKTMDEVEKKSTVKKSQAPSETDSQEWRSRYVEAKTQLEASESKIQLMEKYNTKERSLFEDQIENLQTSLKLAQEGHNNATRLLEDKRGDKDEHWQTAFAKLEEQVSNKEIIANDKLELISTKNAELAKQKSDLKKANMVYAGLAFIIVVGVGIFALMQSGIIQIN